MLEKLSVVNEDITGENVQLDMKEKPRKLSIANKDGELEEKISMMLTFLASKRSSQTGILIQPDSACPEISFDRHRLPRFGDLPFKVWRVPKIRRRVYKR